MLRYLFAVNNRELNNFRERRSRKLVSFEEQMMAKDKYPSTFSHQTETIVFIILPPFFATRKVSKIGEYSPVLAGAEIFDGL